jgi:hypothetical protein
MQTQNKKEGRIKMYIIERKSGEFVARSGSKSSYTRELQNARTFPTREKAEESACGNEHVVNIQDLFNR